MKVAQKSQSYETTEKYDTLSYRVRDGGEWAGFVWPRMRSVAVTAMKLELA
jgi:hypothetical protein